MWITAAVGSAIFAALTSILAKCGIRHTDSDVATALRTVVVLIFSWLMVYIVGSESTITNISGTSLLFLILSGAATGASWLCYFKALALGSVNTVAVIDKTSTVLTVLLAIVLFSETSFLAVKLIGAAVILIGTMLMIEKKQETVDEASRSRSYILYAVGSAVFAALTSILGKVGITGVESNLGTAIRTIVVLIMAIIVVYAKGKTLSLRTLDKRELLFIVLSGIATGASWLCYYYSIQTGVVSIVVPIDKLSLLGTVFFSYLVFKEKLTKKSFTGLVLITVATLAMTIWH
jgi:transporter family protein